MAELFEARSPKDKGVLAEHDRHRVLRQGDQGKIRRRSPTRTARWEELIPKEKNILVHEGRVVNKGESIVDGPADPQDILRLLGMEELARYIVDEVQDVYRLQGVKINDKHIVAGVTKALCRPTASSPPQSFRETTRVLTARRLPCGKRDELRRH